MVCEYRDFLCTVFFPRDNKAPYLNIHNKGLSLLLKNNVKENY